MALKKLPVEVKWWLNHFQLTHIASIIESYIIDNRKKIYPFHLQQVNKHVKEIMENGETICNSDFIRFLIYNELKYRGIKFHTSVVGYGRQLDRKMSITCYGTLNPKFVMYNLHKGRYDLYEVLKQIELYVCRQYPSITSIIMQIFDPNVHQKEKYEMVKNVCDILVDIKFGHSVFCQKKTINKISRF